MSALSFIGWVYLQFLKKYSSIFCIYISKFLKSLKENLKFQKSEKEAEKKNLQVKGKKKKIHIFAPRRT